MVRSEIVLYCEWYRIAFIDINMCAGKVSSSGKLHSFAENMHTRCMYPPHCLENTDVRLLNLPFPSLLKNNVIILSTPTEPFPPHRHSVASICKICLHSGRWEFKRKEEILVFQQPISRYLIRVAFKYRSGDVISSPRILVAFICVAMLGVVKHCIACLPKSMEDALYIHEVLQRNGHRNRGRRC